jgi:BCD family chlorophyll transporter-like MFS transporter
MNLAPPEQRGLALGAWGAVQATGAGIAMALGGVIRDLVNYFAMNSYFGPALIDPSTGYIAVYALEIVLLIATIIAMAPLIKQRVLPQPLQTSSGGMGRSS